MIRFIANLFRRKQARLITDEYGITHLKLPATVYADQEWFR